MCSKFPNCVIHLSFCFQTRYCLMCESFRCQRVCKFSHIWTVSLSESFLKGLRRVICKAQMLQKLIFSWYFSFWMVDRLCKDQISGCEGSLKVLEKSVKKGKHKCKSQTVCLYLGLPLGYFWLCCLFKSLMKSCSIRPSESVLTCALHCCRGANSAITY